MLWSQSEATRIGVLLRARGKPCFRLLLEVIAALEDLAKRNAQEGGDILGDGRSCRRWCRFVLAMFGISGQRQALRTPWQSYQGGAIGYIPASARCNLVAGATRRSERAFTYSQTGLLRLIAGHASLA